MLKLNLGCGNKKKPLYINVDVREDAEPDIVSDAWDLTVFPNDSVDEIYTRHMLEHLDPNDARRSIARWFEILKPGGRLNVIVPDLEFHCRQLLGEVKSTIGEQQAHAMAGFYGWRDESRGGNREDAHRWGYTAITLRDLLTRHGFTDVARRISGIDSEPWHLNLDAWKPGR
jgi:ubiquinone/menaquinone biosynthesis C-methylase UbiE